MNKKWQALIRNLVFIIGLLLVAVPSLVRAQPETTLAVSPAGAEIALGDTFEITLVVTDAVDLNAFDLTVTYDSDVLELVCDYGSNGTACWESGGFLQNLQIFLLSNEPGEFFIAAIQMSRPGQNGDGDLIRLTFRGVGHGESAVTISDANFADTKGASTNPLRGHGLIAVKTVPTTVPDAYEMEKDTALVVPPGQGLLANDSGGPGAVLTAILVSGPGEGTLILGPDGGFTYTPPTGFTGIVGFSYAACDGSICSATTSVSIAVKTLPFALDDAYEWAENTALTIGADKGVLANDSGDPGGVLAASLSVGIPAGEGTLTLRPDGGFDYLPPDDWTGTTMFTYLACDGLICSDPATVTIVIKAVPTALNDDYEMPVNTILAVQAPGVLGNDSGGEGALLKVVLARELDPETGILALDEGGSFTYTPPEDWTGTVNFTYQACDGTICSTPASVTIAVKSVPIAQEDAYEMTISEVLTVTAPGILANDSGDAGALLLVDLLSDLNPDQGELLVNSDGSFTYTPPVDWRGVVSFTYQACDGMICSAQATVNIEVFPPRVPVSGEVTLQGQKFQRGGVPFKLIGQHYGYTYEVETLNQEGINLSLEKVVVDTYLVTTTQPRYLNLHPELEIYITVADITALPPLLLKGGNTVWTDNVINIGDASVIGTYYNMTLEDLPPGELLGDVNFDGVVNIYDLSVVGGNYWLTSEMVYAGWLE